MPPIRWQLLSPLVILAGDIRAASATRRAGDTEAAEKGRETLLSTI
jgi:hypothetical protein